MNAKLRTHVFVNLAALGMGLSIMATARAAVVQFHVQIPPPKPVPQAEPPTRQTTSPPAAGGTVQRQTQTTGRDEAKRTSQRREQIERQQAQQQKQLRKQQQEQARQHKLQQSQRQKQEQENARQQKEQEKQLQKQQQREKQERARQEKQLQKQQQKEAIAAKSKARSSVTRSGSAKTRSVYTVPGGSLSTKTPSGSMVLTRKGSQSVLKQVNSARNQMSGINRKPLPSGDVTIRPNGSLTVNAAGGRQYGVRTNGTVSSYAANGSRASFDSHGRLKSVHTPDMDIRRGPHGERTIVTHSEDHTALISTGQRSGYVERTVLVNNRTFVQRTVLVNGIAHTSFYAPYRIGGVVLFRYVPPVFFAPGFYAWAYYPWAAPIGFEWGWFGEPWYLGLNPFFVAYGVYPSATLWLTDYVIGQTLSTAYQLHEDGLAADELTDPTMSAEEESDLRTTLAADTNTPISDETKAVIEQEIKEQISLDNTAAKNPTEDSSYADLPSALKLNAIFLVSTDLDVSTTDKETCTLEPGDVLRLTAPPVEGSAVVQLRVASSKRTDCPAGAEVGVSLQNLQDMLNDFHTQIELGLATLRDNQGLAALPPAPLYAVAAPPLPSVEGLASIPVEDLPNLLDGQQQQADKIEAEVVTSAFGTSE